MEDSGLLSQLGINWQLFLSQAVNFFILLIVLRKFAYKPLLAAIKRRKEKIQEGLQKAEEADVRLKEVDAIAKDTLKQADAKAISIIESTEEKAGELKVALEKKAEEHRLQLVKQAELEYSRQQEESRKKVFSEAMELVKKTLIKTVQLDPKHIDDALIQKAVTQIKDEV